MAVPKEYRFSAKELSDLSKLPELGVTSLRVDDDAITGSKNSFLFFLKQAVEKAPEVFYTFYVDYGVFDKEICAFLTELSVSLQIVLTEKSLADSKNFQRKIELLNRNGVVFGFDLTFGYERDNIKSFRNRLNFALEQYPNHMDFPQLEQLPVHTKFFSPHDIDTAGNCCFACAVFYTAGRAVPWFLSVLRPLRVNPFKFFCDFAEWLQCNNCHRQTGFDAFAVPHKEIEKMQLLFLQLKYEEKNLLYLFPAVREIVRFNGAFARLVGEGEESSLELDFHPDDLSSPYASDIVAFTDTVCMEHCRVKMYEAKDRDGSEYPDYRVLQDT